MSLISDFSWQSDQQKSKSVQYHRTVHAVVNTHLSFLLIEVVNNDTDEEIESEEGAKYDEDDKVQVHVEVNFSDGLFLHLKPNSFISPPVTATSV